MKKLRAAVAGLGNIGFRFDLDDLRKETWSHVAAYERCDKTVLAAAVEIDKNSVREFKKYHGDIPVFRSVRELMRNTRIDIISVCTPTDTHYSIVKQILDFPVKAVFCEKPLAGTLKEARELVRSCRKKNVILAVNHIRRWDSNYIFVKNLIRRGEIGTLKAVNAFYPGQLFNIGTHLFDTIKMLVEKDAETASGVDTGGNRADPDINGWVRFKGGIPCTVVSTGKREDLIFEVDIVGDKGRIRISENGERIERFSFARSKRYLGYRELFPRITRPIAKKDRLVEAVRDISLVIGGKKKVVNCSGLDGLSALSLSYKMLDSAKQDGKPVEVEG